MSAFELIRSVLEMSKDMSRPVYRGHAKATWAVDSGAVRRLAAAYGDEVLQNEGELRELVRQYRTDELIIPMKVIGCESLTDIQMLSVLQHQGAATMLLDFTENPLVALWFACADKPERDGKVFAVDIDDDPLAWTNGRKRERPLDEDQGLVYYEPDRSLGVRIVAQQSVFLVCNPRIPEWAVKEEKIPRRCQEWPSRGTRAAWTVRQGTVCYSARKFDPSESSDIKGLACRSASNHRAEQHRNGTSEPYEPDC